MIHLHSTNGIDSKRSVLDEKLPFSVSDPEWIRIQLGQRIRIRIGNPDPSRSKLAPNNGKKLINFMFRRLNVFARGLKRHTVRYMTVLKEKKI